MRFGLWLSAAGMPGALIGAYVATLLDKDAMNLAIGGMLIIVLVNDLLQSDEMAARKVGGAQGAA